MDYITLGVINKVYDWELEQRKMQGKPLHNISLHGVEKPGSGKTHLRLVTNSALKTCSTGASNNMMWPKGPRYAMRGPSSET